MYAAHQATTTQTGAWSTVKGETATSTERWGCDAYPQGSLSIQQETRGPKPGEDPLSTHGGFRGLLQKGGRLEKGKFSPKDKLIQTEPPRANQHS